MRWDSNPPCKNRSATKTPTSTLSQQALDGTPATRADMPSMKVKGQTRKEAFDPTRSLTSPRHQVRLGAWNAQTRFAKLTIVQCYAPTGFATADEKDEFYSKLQEVLIYIPKHDITMVMGDLNAKVGSDNTGFEEYMGKQGLGTQPRKARYIEGKRKEIEMKKGPITCLEIEKAIAKSNRAPGEDRITADMLKADPSMSSKCLSQFNKVWAEEKVPDA
ncbi:craniofacial development protein 2 [Elysia marginata]|uniref:Craniofacial development protein 2 n=1 Tax=Elysia marginata TaxID=1093978 RepID=A0AAV4GKG2_9GAST|nr:craniofacial development protein 2 [Elysia marginata]